ncbi:treslin isoform X2 [Biomphalaria glabrata]|nr:treslin isoform X2 [Biomphalaria glabrata]
MDSSINKFQIVFLIDGNLATCEECNHLSEISMIVTRTLLFLTETCKQSKPYYDGIPNNNGLDIDLGVQQSTKAEIQWGFKMFNSAVSVLKKIPNNTKFEHFNEESVKNFEKELDVAFKTMLLKPLSSGNSSKVLSSTRLSSSHASSFLSKALTEIVHDFNWIENETPNYNFDTSPVSRSRSTRKRVNIETDENNVKKIVFLLSRSPSSQKGLRRFSNKLIMDAEIFLDSFMSPALLNEYQNKFKISLYWIDMASQICKSILEMECNEKNDTKVRTIIKETFKMLGGNFLSKYEILRDIPASKENFFEKDVHLTSMQNFFNLLPVEVYLSQLIKKNSLTSDSPQVSLSGPRLNEFDVQLVPLTKELETRGKAIDKSLDLKQAKISWMGCVTHKDVVHLLTTKIITSYILDCKKSDQLLHMHSLLQQSLTLGVLTIKLADHDTVHTAILQPFTSGIAILSLLNMPECFHGEHKILKPAFEDHKKETLEGHKKETFEDFKSRLINKSLREGQCEQQKVISEPNVVQADTVYLSHYLNSWYMPGSLANMSSLISKLNLSSGSLESTSMVNKAFFKELRKHYIKEKQPPEIVQHYQPSTSTPLCAVRKKKADSGDSEASSRSSKPNMRTLRSSTLSRGRMMVDKAMSSSIQTVGDTDTSLQSAPCSPDRRSCNSNGFIDTDFKSEVDLKNYLVKQYEQVLSAGIAVESTVRVMVSVATGYMNSLQYSNPEKCAAALVKKYLVKTCKELKDKYTQNTDRNRKIAEYKLQVLLLLELKFVTRNDEADHDAVLNELILLLRGLMFVTDSKYLNDFLSEVLIVSYAVALPKLLTDVYDELMLPLPPALSKFASPLSSKAPMSVLNEDSFMSAPSSTQPSSHLSDQASQPARSRFKQHPSISDFRHSKQILVKPKLKAEPKSSTKEKVKVKIRSSRRRQTVSSVPPEVGRAKRNLFSDQKKVSQTVSKEEVKRSYKKRSKHSGKPKTLVLGTPSHKQTSQRFLRQQERRRKSENFNPDVKVIAESPLKADDDPSLASALTKSAGHLLRESFYSSSSQPSRNFSRSLELSQKSSNQINLSQESQFLLSRSQGTLSSALRGDSPNISPKTRFIKSFFASPSPEHKTKSLLRRSPRKSAKRLEFKESAGRASTGTENVHLIFDGENANDFNLLTSPTKRRCYGATGYKTPEKQNKMLQWDTASCPPLMVTPDKKPSCIADELGFKNAISKNEDRRQAETKTPVKNMVLRLTPTRKQNITGEFFTPIKGSGPTFSANSITLSNHLSSPTKSTARLLPMSSFQFTPKKGAPHEHTTPKKQRALDHTSVDKLATPSKVKFSSTDLAGPTFERIPPRTETATPIKSILKNSPLMKEKLAKAARRVELQAVTTPLKSFTFAERSQPENKTPKPQIFSRLEQGYASPEAGRSFSPSRSQDVFGRGSAPAAVTIRTPSPRCKGKSDSINTWARRKKCSTKQYSPPSNSASSPAKSFLSTSLYLPNPHHALKEMPNTEPQDTPKKSGSVSAPKHARKRSLFLSDEVVGSPSKRLKKSAEGSPPKSSSLVKTDTITFNPGSSPQLFEDEKDNDSYMPDFQPCSSSVFSQSSQLSGGSLSQSLGFVHCVMTPVKRMTRNSSAAADEGSQGFPVALPISQLQDQCIKTDRLTADTPPKAANVQSDLVNPDKKHFSPMLSHNGLRTLIASPLLSPSSSSHNISKSIHSKSRKHLDLQ